MRTFLIKSVVALVLVLLVHLYAGRFADGRFDDAYLRFTGDRHFSMIIGTSRAAQGLQPALIAPFVSGTDGPMRNFAFTIVHSPYGPSYLRAIECKLDPSARNGIFLLSVDPWSLCGRVDKQGQPMPMQETKHNVVDQFTYTGTPNYEYLIRHVQAGWGSLIGGPLQQVNEHGLLHHDGWLEIRVPMDSASVNERTRKKIVEFRTTKQPRARPSEERVAALKSTIALLKEHGRVYLLRLPVCDSILAIEEEVWPGFDVRMESLAKDHEVPFWNLMPERALFSYTDGNHIDRVSAKKLSTEVGRRLSADLAKRRHEQ
jgi:hypothetical protein